MEEFSTTLEYRLVTLNSATDVVRFSFIVRNSISYLDLELCRNAIVSNYLRICDCCILRISSSFINTEEKCRKFFTHGRNLLYTLHLDLPKGRECSLRNVQRSISFDRDPSLPYIAKIIPTCGLDSRIISNFIEDSILTKKETPKVLGWILKMRLYDEPLLQVLEIRTVKMFVDYFYREKTDSSIFKDFIMHFDFSEWMITYESPEILEFLLYYARYDGNKDLKDAIIPIDEIIDSCVIVRLFLNIDPILKYIGVPRFAAEEYDTYLIKISSLRPALTQEVLEKAEKWLKRERVHQMLQFIWMYIDCRLHDCTEAATEALRLIWCSIPDPYISFKEVTKAFGQVFGVKELRIVYEFYARAVGEFYERVEPCRQHLCRSIIRNVLKENQIWIPDGVRQTGLPKSSQSFLNLEKVLIRSDEFIL